MIVDSHPHEDDDERGTKETLAFEGDEINLALVDMLLNKLADIVSCAGLPSVQHLWLLYGIGKLRGYLYAQSRCVSAEAKGRCN